MIQLTSPGKLLSVLIICLAFLFKGADAYGFQKVVPKGEGESPCNEFNSLNNKIRDGLINKSDALKQLQILLPKIKAFYYSHGGDAQRAANVFPLAGYNYQAIGGANGNGFITSGYDYFDGNKHGGHPAHDIFIHDKNQDCIDDITKQNVPVLSATSGIVIATENNWDEHSAQRGGNYIWIFEPAENKLIYYAHNSKVFVKPGDIVKPGDKIATVGRSGFNASKKRSPTHLHFMELLLDKQFYPKPINCYDELKTVSK